MIRQKVLESLRRPAVVAGGAALSLLAAAGAFAVVAGARAGRICVAPGLALVEDADERCYAPASVAELLDSPVLGGDGAPTTVTLTDPSGQDSAEVPTCADYLQRRREGWYAASARDMAHESWFVRACGSLDALSRAAPSRNSDFRRGRLSQADVAALASTAEFRFGPSANSGAEPDIAADGAGWRMERGGSIARLQPIAHADFDGDGRGEVLVYVDVRPQGGTASAGALGLVEKSARGIAFVPIDVGA